MSEAIEPVDTQGMAELSRLEAIIRRGKETFIEVGRALQSVKEGKLYRLRGHETFEAYCRDVHGFARQTAYHYIAAAEVAQNVSLGRQAAMPAFTQAREMETLEPEQQREVAAALDFNSATVADVRQAVKERKDTPLVNQIKESAPEGARFTDDPVEPDTQPTTKGRDADLWDTFFRVLADVDRLIPRAGRKAVSYRRWAPSEKENRLRVIKEIAPHLTEWITLLEGSK